MNYPKRICSQIEFNQKEFLLRKIELPFGRRTILELNLPFGRRTIFHSSNVSRIILSRSLERPKFFAGHIFQTRIHAITKWFQFRNVHIDISVRLAIYFSAWGLQEIKFQKFFFNDKAKINLINPLVIEALPNPKQNSTCKKLLK